MLCIDLFFPAPGGEIGQCIGCYKPETEGKWLAALERAGKAYDHKHEENERDKKSFNLIVCNIQEEQERTKDRSDANPATIMEYTTSVAAAMHGYEAGHVKTTVQRSFLAVGSDLFRLSSFQKQKAMVWTSL